MVHAARPRERGPSLWAAADASVLQAAQVIEGALRERQRISGTVVLHEHVTNRSTLRCVETQDRREVDAAGAHVDHAMVRRARRILDVQHRESRRVLRMYSSGLPPAFVTQYTSISYCTRAGSVSASRRSKGTMPSTRLNSKSW